MQQIYQFIVNPKSGSTGNVSLLVRLKDYLHKQGHIIHLDLTQSLSHAGELAGVAKNNGANLIIVSGGDGTVRSVVEAMAGSQVPILILPGGTENLLAQELGIDGSFHKTAKILEHGSLRNLDLGSVNGRLFMAITGVGFDAEVIRRINLFRSGHITHGDYIWPICRTFWEYKFQHIFVKADGKVVCDEPALVFIGNISRYAVGLPIVPHADCSDGLLDVCIYKCRRRRELLMHSARTICHRAEMSKNVMRFNCTHLTIDSNDSDVPVQMDGDPGPSLPLDITIVKSAAQVMTPPPPAGQQYCSPVRFYHLRRWIFG